MMDTSAKVMRTDAIPVVDLTSLRNQSDSASVACALHAASQSLGFIYVKGHGIPEHIINAARRSAFDFFRSPETDKATVLISAQHRGWLRPGAAKMQDDAKVDLKESFIWGAQDANGATQQDHPLRGPNQWPSFTPDLQNHAMSYFDQVHEVAFHLMRGFALGLGLNENFFLRSCSRPLSRASFVYYPPQSQQSTQEQFGVGPHTDFGVLTVLCQDDTGGLQVEDINGDWIHAPPIEGTLVVNVGDLLSRWTAGAYKSTPHRVVNSSGRERLSLVLAFDPDPETVIDSRDIFGKDSSAPEKNITCGDYLLWRFAKAFSYRDQDKPG
ncbi:MAG: isopenicillin N synthase family dioxygenase [Granulosicoccus sp.]